MKLIDGNLALASTQADDNYALHLSSTVRDVKNSLGIIVALLEAQQAASGSAATDAADTQMQREVQRIDNALTQLLYSYQLAQGHMQVQGEEVDVRQFVDDLVLGCKYACADRTVRIDCDEQSYPLAFFDRALVRSVMLSTLLSAIRYAHDDVVLHIEQRERTVELLVSYQGEPYPQELVGGVVENTLCSPDAEASSPAAIAMQFAARVAWLHQQAFGDVSLQVGNNESGGYFCLCLPAA